MKQGRTRLIVAQSLITAILLGVIALTLLSPDHQNTLFGVGVPGTPGPIAQSPPSYQPGGGPAGGRAAREPGAHGSGPGATGAAAGTPGAPGTAAAPPSGATTTGPSPTHPGEGDGGTHGPPDDQYADTLARLSDTVD